jgi:A118 family predicted phage portal protein
MNIFEYLQRKGIDTVDTSFYRKIEEWKSWYRSDVRKFHFYNVYEGNGTYCRCRRHSLGMAKQACEDIADLLLNERVKVTMNDDRTYAFVMDVLRRNHFDRLGNEYQERKAACGTVAYVPYIDGRMDDSGYFISGTVGVNYLEAENIYPISWDNGEVTECAFVFLKSYRRKKYANFQFHLLDGGQYVIENTVVECTRGAGRELEPAEWSAIPCFAALTPRIETGSDRPQFVIDKLNLTNNADEDPTNPMGIAIFANAIDVLRKLDLEYDSYANEFTLGRKRIFVNPSMIEDEHGNPVFDPADSVFYRLPEDYKGEDEGFIHEVDMDLRVEQHSKAINDDLNYLSLKCGFGSEHYKFDKGSVRTATEIISENSDMYRSLKKHELVLDEVLKNLIRIIIRLGIACGHPELKPDVDISIDFDDSIIEDKASERAQDRQDVSMGVMSLAEYRAKWYGETEEKAKSRLPEQTSGVMD